MLSLNKIDVELSLKLLLLVSNSRLSLNRNPAMIFNQKAFKRLKRPRTVGGCQRFPEYTKVYASTYIIRRMVRK